MPRKAFPVVSAPHPGDFARAIENIYNEVATKKGKVLGDHIVYLKGKPLTVIVAEIPDQKEG